MIVNLLLAESIYGIVVSEATERGITPEEFLRWIIGDYLKYQRPVTGISILTPPPLPASIGLNPDILKNLSELMVKSAVEAGSFKCPNCTLPLDLEEIEKGLCSKCASPILDGK